MDAWIRLDHQLLAVEGDHTVHAMLELSAPEPSKPTARAPLHLALVIDRSGSMHGAKLEHTKAAATYLLRRLSREDHIALIAYDHEVQLLSALRPVDQDVHPRLISGMWSRGQTNLSGGYLKGVEELRRAPANSSRRVLLLTDGLANEGVKEPDALIGIARQLGAHNIGTTTIGFGEGFDEMLLTRMAEAGGGNSYYAESPDEAPRIFADEFEGLAKLVAQNVSVEIRPTQEVKFVGILNEYPQVSVPGGMQILVGDAYGGERRRVVFELHIPEMARLGVAKVGELVLRYVTVGDQVATHEITIPVTINLVRSDEAAASGPDNEVVEEVTILQAARAQREARDRADQGDFDSAQNLLRSAARDLRARASGSKRAHELVTEAEALERHVEMARPRAWDMTSSKRLAYDSYRKRQSRSSRPPQK
jgi:Ca-activated chloride channel homolog